MELVCPACSGRLEAQVEGLVCPTCDREYATVGGIPILVTALTAQHVHQRAYFDAEFSALSGYEVELWQRSFIERIFRALQLEADRGPYLDVGTGGTGATVIEAARRGVTSIGCDLSVEGIVAAAGFARSEGLADSTTFVVCAAESLPFADQSVGAASAVAVLEHLDDDQAAIRELARVVRPAGRVWVTVPHTYRRILPPLWPVYWVHDRRIGHKRHYGAGRLHGCFTREGFDLVETQFTGHSVKLVQYGASAVANRFGRDTSELWWRLERADLRAAAKPFWALQLSAVFERR